MFTSSVKLALLGLASLTTTAFAAELDFRSAPYEVAVRGNIAAGETITVKYDTNRLNKCTAMGRMYQSFTEANYSFDNGEVQTVSFMTNISTATFTLTVPATAQHLHMWFRNFTLTSPNYPAVCEAYDSNFGSNFNFVVAQ